MSDLAYFTRAPIRAIEVRPVDDTGNLWRATYAGDEWTPALRFDPPLRFATLYAELWRVKERRGLPIIVIYTEAREVAA